VSSTVPIVYTTDSLLNYIEACVDEINCQFLSATIVLAGDFNQLSDHDVAERTGLAQLVRQPTRGPNILDRIFVSRFTVSVLYCQSCNFCHAQRSQSDCRVR